MWIARVPILLPLDLLFLGILGPEKNFLKKSTNHVSTTLLCNYSSRKAALVITKLCFQPETHSTTIFFSSLNKISLHGSDRMCVDYR